jgi:hypothetical protein
MNIRPRQFNPSTAAADEAADRPAGDRVGAVRRIEHDPDEAEDGDPSTRSGRGRRIAAEGEEEERSLRVQDVDDHALVKTRRRCGVGAWGIREIVFSAAWSVKTRYAAPTYLTVENTPPTDDQAKAGAGGDDVDERADVDACDRASRRRPPRRSSR